MCVGFCCRPVTLAFAWAVGGGALLGPCPLALRFAAWVMLCYILSSVPLNLRPLFLPCRASFVAVSVCLLLSRTCSPLVPFGSNWFYSSSGSYRLLLLLVFQVLYGAFWFLFFLVDSIRFLVVPDGSIFVLIPIGFPFLSSSSLRCLLVPVDSFQVLLVLFAYSLLTSRLPFITLVCASSPWLLLTSLFKFC